MKALTQHIDGLMSVDWLTIIVIAVICAAASMLIKEYLAHPPLIIFVYPILVSLSIVASYIVSQLDLYNPLKMEQWLIFTVLATIAGTLAGMALVGGINAIYSALTDPRRASKAAKSAAGLPGRRPRVVRIP